LEADGRPDGDLRRRSGNRKYTAIVVEDALKRGARAKNIDFLVPRNADAETY
jgi:hypothetical protein